MASGHIVMNPTVLYHILTSPGCLFLCYALRGLKGNPVLTISIFIFMIKNLFVFVNLSFISSGMKNHFTYLPPREDRHKAPDFNVFLACLCLTLPTKP